MKVIVISSIIAGLATCLGSLLVIILGKPKERSLSVLFGLASGIMLAVVILDLVPSALEQSTLRQTAAGFSIGVILMLMLDLLLSQIYSPLKAKPGHQVYFLKMGYLVAIGIALHDLPEGIAIAAGYSAHEQLGMVIALAIGLHNIPEGMATATPLRIGGVSAKKILLLNMAVSFFTPLGAYIGIILVNISNRYIGLLLAIAAGAMSFIVKNELLPESRRRHPNYSTFGGILGFLFILGLSAFH